MKRQEKECLVGIIREVVKSELDARDQAIRIRVSKALEKVDQERERQSVHPHYAGVRNYEHLRRTLMYDKATADVESMSYIRIITSINRLKARKMTLQNEIQALEDHLPTALRQRHQ